MSFDLQFRWIEVAIQPIAFLPLIVVAYLNGTPNGSISRLPDATRNLRAPKDDDNAKVALELGA